MVGVIGEKMVLKNFLEFVLLKEQVDPKFALVEKRVNFLFDVQLKRSEEEDSQRCWVKVEGNEDDIRRAKEYIIEFCSGTLCSLEEAEIVWNENNNTSSQIDSALTKQAPSVVDIKKEECNRDHITQQALSSSETTVTKKSNQVDLGFSSRTENSNDSCAESKELDTRSQECADVANCEKVAQRTADEMVANRTVVNKPDEIEEKAQVRDAENTCDVAASGESLRDFAKKLGYHEDTIATGLSKLGASADTNSLLSELVKAQSSVKQLEEGSSTFSYEKPHPALEDSSCLRPIVIDGSNVAMSHGTQRVFSCRGIGIVVDWFLQRNHRDIKVFVPKWREKSSRPDSPIVNQEVLKRLEQDRLLVWTPSRTVTNGRIIKCYDDRYIIKHAADNDGVVVSNDNFRDLLGESHEWKKVIEQRLLMYTFVDDKFMPPDDPLGRHGPTLDEFLKKGCGKLCPYLRNCTYGKRCRFLHPDRNPVKEVDSYLPSTEHLPPEVPYGQVSRPNRPLPPCPPEVPRHTRPLPSVPTDFCQKPLPLPPHSEFPAEMARVFPPTLRSGQAVGIGQRRSDPLPGPKRLPPEVQMMQDRFQRTHSVPSVPSVQEQAYCGPPPGAISPVVRRGSVPHVCHPPPPYSSPSGPPEIMVRGGSMPLPSFPNDSGVNGGEWMLQEQMFGRHPYPYPPQFPSNPSVSSHPPGSLPINHWNLPPFPQQHHQYPAAHQQQYQHYGPGPPGYAPGYGRTPYHGQRNGYYRSRAPPIVGGMCDDVTDNPKESGDSSHEELRIRAYDKLCELFPDDVEKVLKLLDKYSDETSVETLTQHMLDDADD